MGLAPSPPLSTPTMAPKLALLDDGPASDGDDGATLKVNAGYARRLEVGRRRRRGSGGCGTLARFLAAAWRHMPLRVR